MEYFSGNKIPIGSTEVPIDSEYPDEVTNEVSTDGLSFRLAWLAFKVKKSKK